MADLACGQRCKKGSVVNERAAAWVDENDAFGKPIQVFGIQKVFGLRRIRHKKYKDLRCAQGSRQTGFSVFRAQPLEVFRAPTPARDRKPNGAERLCSGLFQFTEA